jgi:hypothetical protein
MIFTWTVFEALQPPQVFMSSDTHGKYPITDRKPFWGSVIGLVPRVIVHGLVAGHAGPIVVNVDPGNNPTSLTPWNERETVTDPRVW